MLIRSAQGFFEFKIAARRAVHDQSVVAQFDPNGLQMRQRRFLRICNVLQQRASGRDTTRQTFASKATQVARTKLVAKQARCAVELEMPRWPARDANIVAE